MSLDKLTGPLSPSDVSVATDVAGLARLKTAARERSPEALEAVAKQFESLFLEMMLKSMREASLGEGMFDSEAGDLYQGMFDKQIALDMARGKGLGIADLLVRQLSPVKAPPQGDKAIELNPQRRLQMELPIPALPLTLPAAQTNRGIAPELAPLITPSSLTPKLAPLVAPSSPASELAPLVAPPPLAPQSGSQALRAPQTEAVSPAGQPSEPTANSSSTAEPARAADWKPATPEDFVREILPHARKAAQELGINPLGIVAQAALETGWGRNVVQRAEGGSSFNLFGIKAGSGWEGERAASSTVEFEGDVAVRRRESFRSYSSVAESFADYVKLLSGHDRYREVLRAGPDAGRFAESLGRSGYATDPDYASKIKGVLGSEPLRGVLTALKNLKPGSM